MELEDLQREQQASVGFLLIRAGQLWNERAITEINQTFGARVMREAAEGPLKGILEYTSDPIVSTDVVGQAASSIFDSQATMAISKRMVKVVAWYDNEWGYSSRVVDLMQYAMTL